MSYQYVNVAITQKVTAIEFNYTCKPNALSKAFIDDLAQAPSDLNRADTRCIILRAPNGTKVFSAGHDIHEFPIGRCDPLPYDDPLRQITRMTQGYPKLVISMVEGGIWDGASEMIMNSDLIIAAEAPTFSMTPVNLGIPCNLVGIHSPTRDAGSHTVKGLIFTASPITAQRAMAVGTLNHVVPVKGLKDFALQMTHHISEKAPLVIAVIEEELRAPGEAYIMNFDELERIQGTRRAVCDSEGHQEGVDAFMEEHKPNSVGHQSRPRKETAMKRMSTKQAVEIIQYDDMVASSGFTPAGSPKTLLDAIAQRTYERHQNGQPFQVHLLTGTPIGAAADDILFAVNIAS